MTMTTEEILWRQVIQTGDGTAKAALADVLEESGATTTARAIRWCLKWNRWPDKRRHIYGWSRCPASRLRRERVTECRLPPSLFFCLPGCSGWTMRWWVNSRGLQKAISKLALALERATEEATA